MSQLETNTNTLQSIIEKLNTKIADCGTEGYCLRSEPDAYIANGTVEFDCTTINNLMGWIVWCDDEIIPDDLSSSYEYITSIIWTNCHPDYYIYQLINSYGEVTAYDKKDAFSVEYNDGTISISENLSSTRFEKLLDYKFIPFYSK
jgi:hypothetical protein